MSRGFPETFEPDGLTAARVWSSLPPDARLEAARELYAPQGRDPASRRLADAAVAAALRSREIAVRRWPVERRIAQVSRMHALDESLAAALLLALHLGKRRPMLAAFLDSLGIEHDDGKIRDAARVAPPPPAALAAACERLLDAHPPDHVEVYLASLLALDPGTWGGLAEVLERLRRP